ncbi:MAG TPA: GGDEF domain-containing protein [Pyrinomonadaceae bacterium]|jgi:diguanylate cyclase (GGDEF)-like protein|nr:GGDEF domain-containing protein [Pyrinomonadaceae bacterium]
MHVTQIKQYREAVDWFRSYVIVWFNRIVTEAIPYMDQPEELSVLNKDAQSLVNAIYNLQPNPSSEMLKDEIPTELLPLLKRVLLMWRREKTRECELHKTTTVNPAVLDRFDSKIRVFDQMLNDPTLETVEPARMPLLLDYLSIQKIESLPELRRMASDRRYDEKFHILQAPDLFLTDVAYFREKCELRGTPFTIAFVDIDDFKSLNTQHGHDAVDRYVLPFFMRCLESQIYNHGYGYRFGGDEYLILLPNFDHDLAVAFLEKLRDAVSELTYTIPAKTTVSIGICVVAHDCALTDKELKERAGAAMEYAKAKGKNRMVFFRGNRYRTEDLQLTSRKEHQDRAHAAGVTP